MAVGGVARCTRTAGSIWPTGLTTSAGGNRTANFTEINDCAEWLGLLAAGRYDYVVVAASAFKTTRPSQADWTLRDPRAHAVFVSPRATLIRLNGAPNQASCRATNGFG